MGNGNNISHHHHYVPQFYQKYFSDENGKIYALNKLNNKTFCPNPNDIFAEEDRNTFINHEGKESDWIEKFYSEIEKHCSIALREFANTGSLSSTECKRFLILFAYLSKWRSPAYDDSYEYVLKNLSFSDLRLHFGNLNLGTEYDLEKAWNDDEMQATKRLLLSIQPFIYKKDYEDIFKNTFILGFPEQYNAIIGSCPFVENPINSTNVFESFIFPLSPTYSLIYLNHCDIKAWANYWNDNYNLIMPLIANLRDLSIYHFSKDIVISNNPKRLQTIKTMYEKMLNSSLDVRRLPGLLFQTIFDPFENNALLNTISDSYKSLSM